MDYIVKKLAKKSKKVRDLKEALKLKDQEIFDLKLEMTIAEQSVTSMRNDYQGVITQFDNARRLNRLHESTIEALRRQVQESRDLANDRSDQIDNLMEDMVDCTGMLTNLMTLLQNATFDREGDHLQTMNLMRDLYNKLN